MTRAEIADKKARAIIASRTTEQLVNDFEATETSNDPNVYIVRGWLMDELEMRSPEAFEAWIDGSDDSPRKYYIA